MSHEPTAGVDQVDLARMTDSSESQDMRRKIPEQENGSEEEPRLPASDVDNWRDATKLTKLGWSCLNRFRDLGELKDLKEAMKYFSSALALSPEDHPDMPLFICNLGISYEDQYKHLGEFEDLDKSIKHKSRAINLTPNGHPDMPHRLDSLGISYLYRFHRLGKVEDLEKSIEYKSRAVHLTPNGHPDMPHRLDSLGISYRDRYQRLGKIEDLEKSIEYASRAVDLTPNGHPDTPQRLESLGIAYRDRYRHLGQVGDLENSIKHKSRAVDLTPNGHPHMPCRIESLANSYSDRFRRLGELQDLEKSIEHKCRAVDLTPNGHLDMPQRLESLGISYQDRFRRLGEIQDLDKSIEHASRAVDLTPNGHPDMPQRLHSLGISYGDRYQRLGELADLEKSIEHKSRAVDLTPNDHPGMPRRLHSLGISYRDRLQRLGGLEDLERFIEHASRAVDLTPNGHPDLPRQLNGLGVSYSTRFRRLGNVEDLQTSIELYARALELTPNGHQDMLWCHHNLAISYFNLFQRSGDHSYCSSSLRSFRSAHQLLSGPPRDSFQLALKWATLASTHTALNPIEAYQTTINLLPQFIWLGATTAQRYYDLSTVENLAVNAAKAAIFSSNFELALEWLEHTRCVVWTQTLMLRSPLDQLHSSHPDLATRLHTVINQLDCVESDIDTNQALSSPPTTREQAGQHRRRLAHEYHSLLAQARQFPGLHDFLQPMKARGLACVARNGPIVVINSHKTCCDALIIMPGRSTVDHLHLPNFNNDRALLARSDLQSSLRRKRLRERGVKLIWEPEFKDRMGSVLEALWSNVVQPVLDFLGYMNDTSVDHLPHITWCPTGALSFLPLHAAGNYNQPRSRVFNYAISSYTPTLTALLSSSSTTVNRKCRVLAVGQANTPGHNPLPGTAKELASLQAHTQGKVEYSQLLGRQATTIAVLDAMEKHDWVHLACHAHQNASNPTKSGFHLHDGTLDLTAINRRLFKNKGLAYLSACQTATGDEKLPDEAIHLASGMLMAGYPSVIATMWSVLDEDAPLVADKVYAELMKEGKVGNGEAGKALHYAVAALRDKVGETEFGRWASYIHIGS